ncbi:MAP7 domain-containing protein 3 isoform X4 [Bos javanicus]|uniref:MAP7 domain-containing protein 3 isoform X4 n=1 Tax=Bos javanicus TaxID=9906 RepID=UPI002AA83D88|nr:MAP7 domain-containing protein 3 isoform X4 [Bos javanicus]
MAERAGGGTSLRGLRERMVAAANAIAEERRSQGSFSSLPSQPSNIKSPFKPVIDGSVLKNDIKQRLAKERREEKKRQDDANKETQLLEKERKSKIVYEKQMEEKQRKLREQKEKDEQRRISAEKKRNEMLEEEREKFKAVLHRTLERSSRVDRQKRWSWAGYTTVNSQNKTVNKHSTSTEKLEQGTCGLHRQMSSTGLQNSVAKKTPEKRRSSSLNRRCSRLHSSTETEQVEEKRPGIHSVIQYVNIPLLRHSSDELKSTIVPRQSTAVMPFQEKVNVEAPPEVSVEAFPEESMKKHPKVSVETFLEASMKEHPGVNVEALAEESMKEHPGVNVEVLAEESMKEHPKVRVDALLEVSMKEHPAVSVEALPEESMKEHPAVSVEALAEESMKEHPKVRVDALLKVSMKEHPEVSVEALVEASMKEHPAVNVEALAEASMKEHPKVSVDSLPEVSTEEHPKVSVEALPEVNMEGPCANVETSPETSEDLSLEAHVGPSPEVSMDSSPDVSVNPSPEVSMDSSQEVSTEASSEASVDISPEASMVTLPEESVETSPEESVEAFSAASMDALPEGSVEVLPKETTKGPSEASVEAPLETSPEVTVEISSKKSEMDEQPSNPITKKRIPPSQIPCYRWSSSPTRRWRPPSPISASRQIQKNCPPSPSPGTSKQSTQFCFSYKVIPTQRTVFAQNALGTMGMKSKAVSNTINNSEAASQKDMICEESGNKGTPGPKNAEEATKILAEKRRLAREQKEKEERLQKEMEQRKMKDVAKKVDEGQEDEFSKFGDGQQPKEMKKRESQEQEDQKVELQKSDAKIKAQEEADKRKKEHERIMLQNLQERLERKKRIEEIMKRTRKPDSNASKATETLSSDAYEEDEADDEDESESDSDSFDDVHPSATINGMDSSPKPKTHVKNVKNTSKFLDVTSSHIHKETKAFLNTDMKTFRQKGVKDPLNQTKSTRSSTKRPTNRAAKTGKAETSSTMRPSRSSHSEVQKWVCDRIINFSRETEPPVSSFPPESPKLQLRGSVTSCLSHQPPIDNKNRSKSVPAPSDM